MKFSLWNRILEIGNWIWIGTRLLAGIWRQGLGHWEQQIEVNNEL